MKQIERNFVGETVHTKLLISSSLFNETSVSSYALNVRGVSRQTQLSVNCQQDCVYIGTDVSLVGNLGSSCVIGGSGSSRSLSLRSANFASSSNNLMNAYYFNGSLNEVFSLRNDRAMIIRPVNLGSGTNSAFTVNYLGIDNAVIRNDGLATFNGLTLGNGTDLTMGSNSRFIGNFRANYLSRASANSPYTLSATDYVVDSTSGALTINLPTAVGITGRVYIIANSTPASTVTINSNGGTQFIGNGASNTYILAAGGQGTHVTLMSTGSKWAILAA